MSNLYDSNRIYLRREVTPHLKDYQILGDSQFLRFAEQLLNLRRRKNNGDAFNGLCVSGQRITDLMLRVKSDVYPITEKCIMMIGTNDILQNSCAEKMCEEIEDLITEIIKKGAMKLIILTIPPIPRLANQRDHWSTLKAFNKHIKSLANGKDIFVVDAYKEFIRKPSDSSMTDLRNSSTSCALYISSGQTRWSSFCVMNVNGSSSSFFRTHSCKYNPYSDYHVDAGNYVRHPVVRAREDDHAESIKLHLFEKNFNESNKPDLIHLNIRGLNVIKELILSQDFF